MKDNEVHELALKRFSEIWDAVYIEREQCLEDRRFYSVPGAQWEGNLGEQFANKARMEFNKVHMAVIHVINEQRNNRITVDFVSKDGGDDTTADICDALMRADEERSNAQDAYDTSFEEKTGGGIGGWRLVTEYEDEADPDNDKQRISFQPIPDADQSIFFDLNCKRTDKLDAQFAFVITEMQTSAYREKFDDDPASWPVSRFWGHFDWNIKDTTYVAEYYVKETEKAELHYYTNLNGETEKFQEEELTEEKIAHLEAVQTKFSHKRKIKKPRVRKYIMSGAGIIEDTGYIAGKHIPIVIEFGKRWIVDGVERVMGRVRLAKDAQRTLNVQYSTLVNQSSQTPQEVPIFAAEQMADRVIVDSWANAAINNPAYLTVNPMMDTNGNPIPAGPIGYTKPPQVAPVAALLLQASDALLKDILGTNDRGDELQSNVSGEAIGKVQDRIDMNDFIYLDGHAKAHKTSGKIWLSMAKDVYVEKGRKMKTVSELGKTGVIELGQEVLKDGATVEQYDFTKASFEVIASVGKSFSSKRKSMLASITALMQVTANPEDASILTTMAMMNIEGEGMDDIRDYSRKKLVNMGVVKPTDEEKEVLAEEAANAKPDANEEFLKAKTAEAEGQRILDLAETEKHQGETRLIDAKTEQTHLENEIKDQESGLNMINTLTDIKIKEQQPIQATATPQVASQATNQP